MSGKIPFVDLVAPHVELEAELVEMFRGALHSAAFIGGPNLDRFENNFATFCEAKHCAGVANGTDALLFALIAAGINKGDTVITVPNTFIATAEAITHAGAHPEFVDIDETTYNMDPVKLRSLLESCRRSSDGRIVSTRTGTPITAVLPVHLYGQMADMDAICEIAEEFGLIVIEDACQAHDSTYFSNRLGRWVKAGSIGKAAGFSFYPGKNLGACGEAGAVTTNDPAIVAKVKTLRDHGQAQKYYHDLPGFNGRLDSIQAGILDIKLKKLQDWTSRRRALAKRYNALLEVLGDRIITPTESQHSRAVYHLYVVRVSDRQKVQDRLSAAGIGTGIHYPVPLHLQKAYASLGYAEGSFPIAETVAPEILSLPMYPQLTKEQQDQVATELAMALADAKPVQSKSLVACAS